MRSGFHRSKFHPAPAETAKIGWEGSEGVFPIAPKCHIKSNCPPFLPYLSLGIFCQIYLADQNLVAKIAREPMPETSNYLKAKSGFKGCRFDCLYCRPSFQRQAKRQKQKCTDCYHYRPHYHPERLNRIPSADIIFVAGNGDLAFCIDEYTRRIIASIREHNKRCPEKVYYFQSKKPECLKPFLKEFPDNVILVTTLETNRDQGYLKVSKAPVPSERYRQFKALDWPRKVVTVEPVMDFDLDGFGQWLINLNPEYVWLGYNSRPRETILPEPSRDKLRHLIDVLQGAGIEVRGKDLRSTPVSDRVEKCDSQR